MNAFGKDRAHVDGCRTHVVHPPRRVAAADEALTNGDVFAKTRAVPQHDPRQSLGIQGEQQAEVVLRQRGYAILARRYRTRAGEIDLVASLNGVLVFVEVKLRRSHSCGTAVDAVTSAKRHRLVRMAHEYLWRHSLHDHPCRFDIVAIDQPDGEGPSTMTVFEDAFSEGE